MQIRRASWREAAQYDVRESGLHGGQGGLPGVDAGHVPEKDPRFPSLLGFITSSNVAASSRIVVVLAQPFCDVT